MSPENAARMAAEGVTLPSDVGANRFVRMLQDTMEASRGSMNIEAFKAERKELIDLALKGYVDTLSPHLDPSTAATMIARQLDTVVKEVAQEVGARHASVAQNITETAKLGRSLSKLSRRGSELTERQAEAAAFRASSGPRAGVTRTAGRKAGKAEAETILEAQRASEIIPVLEDLGVPESQFDAVIARLAKAGPKLGMVDLSKVRASLAGKKALLGETNATFNKDLMSIIEELEGLGPSASFDAVKTLRTGFTAKIKDMPPAAAATLDATQKKVRREMTKAMERTLVEMDQALGLPPDANFSVAWRAANDATIAQKSQVSDALVRGLINDIENKGAGADALRTIVNIDRPCSVTEIERLRDLIGSLLPRGGALFSAGCLRGYKKKPRAAAPVRHRQHR